MYPTDLPTPTDALSRGPGCPDCGSSWGDPEWAHGAPEDRSLTGLLCCVRFAASVLLGEQPDAATWTPQDVAALLLASLVRFGVPE